MAKRSLYVSYVRLDYQSDAYLRPVYCYACSYCHAMNLAIRFCVDVLEWPLNSIKVSKPIFINHFIR